MCSPGQWLGGARERIGLRRLSAWFDEVWNAQAGRPEARPGVDECEELAWLDGARARLDDELG
ncbi:MAG TPA: hypothetical protein VHW23_05390 [Kofleriaceae bacterium]|jgi:hypothetical protein|nr:hypothetical protein [Kofleriaceae bacterium]